MIVTCECNNCLLKDLCINRNQRLKAIDGPEHFYVQLSCNHLHAGKVFHYFNCDKCKNKSICKIFKDSKQAGNTLIDFYLGNMVEECNKKLNKNAFEAILCCKGYME